MSRKPDNFDELLNAKLDDELSPEERSQVEDVLEQDREARDEYESLKDLSGLLKEHFTQSSSQSPSLGSQFTASVLAACESTGVEEATSELAERSVKPADNSSTTKWIVAAAALAASIALVAYLPSIWAPASTNGPQLGQTGTTDTDPESTAASSDPTNPFQVDGSAAALAENSELPESEIGVPNGDSPEPTSPVEYVSEMQFPAVMYLLEVDIEATAEALEQRKIQDILKKHGIDPKEPLAANDQVQGMIEQARMNVGQSGQSDDAYVHLVRAPIRNLGAALDEIYGDKVSFPNVKFALGFDTPNVGLFKTLLKNSGTRFASDESFMAPVGSGEAGRASPFSGLGSEGKLVSASSRERGFGQLNMLSMDPSKGEAIENLILFVRLPK